MKKFLGISKETHFAMWAMIVMTGTLSFYYHDLIGVLCFLIGIYAGMVYYFKYVFPYRPFEIVLYGNLYRKGDTLAISSSGKRVVVKKILSSNPSGTRMLVKPIKEKQLP